MISKPFLVRITDDEIINLANVASIKWVEDKLLCIYMMGEPKYAPPAIVLEGDEAKAMWIYFSSQMMSFHPLKITNPGRETLDIPKSTDDQSH
ncbi:MAG: hypothetical protein RMY28_037350 [Nostoc sp. ChiSLP01]|nr:hypothetical protein [Nostoc sp. CmiSLP01]MDZ8287357.1 hypothetical protein [Nostoc sp. ChiSLP01]